MMDWEDLRHFYALSRLGTLSAAARALGVEHATVARRVAHLEEKTGTKLETLADARAFILDMLPESDHDRSSWQHATELLIEAAERGGSIEATTEQIERALFLQGMWMPK